MVRLCQRDKRWATTRIGSSPLTVGRMGCTLTCVCMAADYFGEKISPSTLAKRVDAFTKDGLAIWEKLGLTKAKFAVRIRARNDKAIAKSLLDPNEAVMLEVDNSHWLVAVRRNGESYRAADPLTGTDVDVLKRYQRITGSAHFRKI